MNRLSIFKRSEPKILETTRLRLASDSAYHGEEMERLKREIACRRAQLAEHSEAKAAVDLALKGIKTTKDLELELERALFEPRVLSPSHHSMDMQ